MKKIISNLLLLSLISLFSSQAKALDLPKAFTTDFAVTLATDGSQRESGRVFSANPELIRTELKTEGKDQINIYRDHKRYVLYPDRKWYRVFSDGHPLINEFSVIYQTDTRWEKIGDKEISGKSAIKWNVTYHVNNQDKTVKVWTDANNNNPLRIKVDNKIVNLTNFKEGDPDPSLFEVPRNYTEIQDYQE
ncbi:MAG: hypothetical protein K1X66_03850 [Verrucomicrobiae bacterium]|nr:hypothetical protein [Verrucomicrobiae bacterium]